MAVPTSEYYPLDDKRKRICSSQGRPIVMSRRPILRKRGVSAASKHTRVQEEGDKQPSVRPHALQKESVQVAFAEKTRQDYLFIKNVKIIFFAERKQEIHKDDQVFYLKN